MPSLLVIDDDGAVCDCLSAAFSPPEVAVETAASLADGLQKFRCHTPEVVLLDMDLPDATGLDGFRRIHELDPRVPVIFLTGHGNSDTAIEAMTLGAYEYIHKPPNMAHLRALLFRAFEVSRLMRLPVVLADVENAGDTRTESIIGRCPGMLEVCKAIGRVAPQDVTCLILGESGTGKELVARAIYHYSQRSHGPFLAINCAAIPEHLLESELFGHEKGAFTGAITRHIGKFEQCSGGTLFLDEIGDMAPLTQTKILRVLQTQQFERIGGHESIHTDVRVIAATNRDLEQAMAAGEFRGDLYYRLNVFGIRLPALRERLDDLDLLVRHYLGRYCVELGKDVSQVAPATMDLLRQYSWPGNVRELQSVLKYALLHARGSVLLPDFLPTSVRTPGVREQAIAPLHDDWDEFLDGRLRAGSSDLYAEWHALTDARLFRHVVNYTQGNLSHAARILGLNRATVRSRLEALNPPSPKNH